MLSMLVKQLKFISVLDLDTAMVILISGLLNNSLHLQFKK